MEDEQKTVGQEGYGHRPKRGKHDAAVTLAGKYSLAETDTMAFLRILNATDGEHIQLEKRFQLIIALNNQLAPIHCD